MERPTYLYRAASNRKRYPCWPVWYRERHPIKKHFRVLDCENDYDSDDFFKVELRIASDPAYTEYINPNAKQRLMYQRRAKVRAQAILREIETYKQNAAWRKRLTRAKNEFEFVWEPYEKALRKKYGWDWKWQRQRKIYEAEMQADLDRRRDEYLAEQKRTGEELNRLAAERRSAERQSLPKFSVRVGYPGPFRDMSGYYGPAERASDLDYIKRCMKWIDGFDNPYFTRIVVKIMDEQKDIRNQVYLLNRIETAAREGQLQSLLEELNRRAGLYAA